MSHHFTTVDLRVTIRILLVSDGAIELWDTPAEPREIPNKTGFSLREMAKALWVPPPGHYPYTRFAIDHAVHGTGNFEKKLREVTVDGRSHSWTEIRGFRFDANQVQLNNYSQIWLFGFWPGNPNNKLPADRVQLSQAELHRLTTWMNAGGGVFATGDHGLLGAHLAGDVPRVRSMRRWAHRGFQDDVPSPDQVDRVDTIVPVRTVDGLPAIKFEDQSDNVPKRVFPKRYTLWDGRVASSNQVLERAAPHPVLCCPLGPIDVLPDHMHEGLVRQDDEVFSDAKDITGAPEFPGGLHGPRPEVISWTSVRGGDAIYDDMPGPTQDSFSKSVLHRGHVAVTSVYDGQRAGVGRVVVDSTWHNWLDINVTGLGEPNTTGLLGKNLELTHYYFRNIAQWLASPETREAMRSGLLFHAVTSTGGWSELNGLTAQLGERAHDVLGRVASECERTGLVFEPWWDAMRFADILGNRTHVLPLPSKAHMSRRILGAMTEAVFASLPELELTNRSAQHDEGEFGAGVRLLVRRLREARKRGIRLLSEEWRESLNATGKLLDAFEEAACENETQSAD